jgi:hypothetical protein
VAAVEQQRAAVGILDHGHVTDGPLDGVHPDRRAGIAFVVEGCLDAVHAEGDCAAVAAG